MELADLSRRCGYSVLTLCPDRSSFTRSPTAPLSDADVWSRRVVIQRVGGFRSFNTTRLTILGFDAKLWLRKGFGFAGAWTVHEQNWLRALCFGLPYVNEG